MSSLEKIENTKQEEISKLSNDSKATYINANNNIKKIDDLLVNKTTVEDVLKEQESKMITLVEIQNSLSKLENNSKIKDFSDSSNPNIEENIKKVSEEETKKIDKVMDSLININMNFISDLTEISDENNKEIIEKTKKELNEKISNVVSNLNKIEKDLFEDFSQMPNNNFAEMIKKENEERENKMREKIESLKKINFDLMIDFSKIKNKFIVEDMKKEEEGKLEVISNVIGKLRASGIKNWKETEMSDFKNENITALKKKKKKTKKNVGVNYLKDYKEEEEIHLTILLKLSMIQKIQSLKTKEQKLIWIKKKRC